jgi:predicted Zn-dependent protease
VTRATGRAAIAACTLLLGAAAAQPSRAQNPFDRLRRAAQSVTQVARTLLPISTPKEIEIGRGVAATIAGRYPVVDDTALTRYVSLVGLAVAGEDPRADIAYRFAVLETPTVNAFAAPGGYIFITRGALDLIANESELAGVLGHEVGHANRRHVIEAIRKSDTMRAVRDQVDVSGAVLDQVVGTGANALFTGLSRGDELEADSLGFEYASSAGYDPNGLADFIARLDRHAGEGPVAELFATHPHADERLAQLTRINQRESWPPGPTLEGRYRAALRRP